MLSNQPSNMDQRRRQHRRQQSTPTAFEAHNNRPVSFPATRSQQQHGFPHSRGLGLAQNPTSAAIHAGYVNQEGQSVGMTNPGHQLQHYLQEAQQHCQARPGQQQQQITPQQPLQLSEQEFRNLQHQQLDAQLDSLMRCGNLVQPMPNESHVVKIERSRSNPEAYNGMNYVNIPDGSTVVWQQHGVVSGPDESDDHANQRPSSAKSDIASLFQRQRTHTGQNQIVSRNRPITPKSPPSLAAPAMIVSNVTTRQSSPADGDSNATIKAGKSPTKPPPLSAQRMFEISSSTDDSDPNATIKGRPRPMLPRAHSQTDIFDADRMDVTMDVLPSPPNTAPMKTCGRFDVAVMPKGPSMIQDGIKTFFAPGELLHRPPEESPKMSPLPQTPGSIHDYRGEDMSDMLDLPSSSCEPSPVHTTRNSIDFSQWGSPSRQPLSPRTMSIADLDLDATVEETGISADEVQSHISQQDPETGKWTCLFEEDGGICGKIFGRKENVRAHVQTHLGDRQFKCIHCGKCFVRQHDLKRHSKTHSGVKPYPCRCGNSFARHDALTRHRQRGICSGGFEGVIKKMAKRGRPRKDRPNDDDRMDKASRTRQRAIAKSYASSVSGTSESSFAESPESLFDDLDFEPTQPGQMQYNKLQSLSIPPEMLSRTPPESPLISSAVSSPRKFYSSNAARTPASMVLDHDSPADLLEGASSQEMLRNPTQSSIGSQANSPPGLSHSSPPSSTRLLDFDFGTNFDSSGSDPTENSKVEGESSGFDPRMFVNSMQEMFSPSWDESNFLNFDKDASSNSFTNSFDDDLLFSDDVAETYF